jgi:hypothetical protein
MAYLGCCATRNLKDEIQHLVNKIFHYATNSSIQTSESKILILLFQRILSVTSLFSKLKNEVSYLKTHICYLLIHILCLFILFFCTASGPQTNSSPKS